MTGVLGEGAKRTNGKRVWEGGSHGRDKKKKPAYANSNLEHLKINYLGN